jgi:hypothetical protein
MLNIALQGFDQSEIVAEEKEQEQNYLFSVIRLKLKILNFVTQTLGLRPVMVAYHQDGIFSISPLFCLVYLIIVYY